MIGTVSRGKLLLSKLDCLVLKKKTTPNNEKKHYKML